MNLQYERTKVLITVMTYPHPSRSYQELVCTAGITDQGDWVRLYPINYRYLPIHLRFHKYQWIDVGLSPRGNGNDNRKESRSPDMETIEVIGSPLNRKDNWRERRAVIDKLPVSSLNQLRTFYETDRTSLGVVCPTKVIDLKIERTEDEWKPEWQALFSQFRLFGEQQKPLRKIPYKFSYVFEFEDSAKPHNAMIEDWELGVLWLKEVERLGDERKAAQSVRNKYLNEVCAPEKDTRFFMGTIFPYNTWVVVGVFWPPKLLANNDTGVKQLSLL